MPQIKRSTLIYSLCRDSLDFIWASLNNKLILLGIIFLFLSPGIIQSSAETIQISSPLDGAEFTDADHITLYASLSNTTMSTPFIKYSYDPSQGYPLTAWDCSTYIYNLNFSDFPIGLWSIMVYSGSATDTINVTISQALKPDPTPTPTPEPIKYLAVLGLEDGNSYPNSSMFIQATDNDTTDPVPMPTWKIWGSNQILNSGTGYFSGRALIEWQDDFGKTLPDGGYLIQISATGYETSEYLINLVTPEPEVASKPELTIFGLDKKVTDNIESWITVLDPDDNYIEGISVKVLDPAGTVRITETTNTIGRVNIPWSLVGINEYAVEFSHPKYKTTVVDIQVMSSISTPVVTQTVSPTPTPNPPPVLTPNPTIVPAAPDEGSSVPATTKEEEESDPVDTVMSFIPWAIAGVCIIGIVHTKFPDQSKALRDGAGATASSILNRSKRAKEAVHPTEVPVCHAMVKGPDEVETQCTNPVMAGQRYCTEHIHLSIKTTEREPEPVAESLPGNNGNGSHPQPIAENTIIELPENTESEGGVLEDIPEILMQDDKINEGMEIIINGYGPDDIKSIFLTKYNLEVPDVWITHVSSYVKDGESSD